MEEDQRHRARGSEGSYASGFGPEEAKGAGQTEQIEEFQSGAKSSGRKPRYDLIPGHALRRIVRRFELGASKYGENNWKKGAADKAFVLDRINHAIDHLLNLADQVHADGFSDDDDAAAVAHAAVVVMEWQVARLSGRAT